MANMYTASIPPAKELLESLYHEKYMTQEEVGKHLGVSGKQIQIWFKKLGIKARKAAKRFQSGQMNSQWKNKNACYSACHNRVYAARGKARHCSICGRADGNSKYHWANLTGNYEDINDFAPMCVSCHHKHDNKHLNFLGKGKNMKKILDLKAKENNEYTNR